MVFMVFIVSMVFIYTGKTRALIVYMYMYNLKPSALNHHVDVANILCNCQPS